MSCPHRFDVAAYALGTLDPPERDRLSAHLPHCAECTAELTSVHDLPALLARVDPADIVAEPAAPSEEMFHRLLRASVAERARTRRRVRYAAVAAAAVLAAAGAGVALSSGTSPGPAKVEAAAQGAVHAQVTLRPTASGTALTLRLSGVAPEQRCRLVAVARSGEHEIAATWEATYHGSASVTGSVAIPMGQLSRLVVQTLDDRELVAVNVR